MAESHGGAEGTGAHTEADGGSGGFPPFDPSTFASQLVSLVIAFVALLGVSLGAVGWIGGIAPLALTIAIYALEILVAFLQAYVFAILTVIYLNDAIHPGH